MDTNRIRRLVATGLASLAVLAAAGTAAAAAPEQYRFSQTITVDHACGVVETTVVTINEKAFFDNGEWVRSVVNFTFDGVYAGPTGRTFAAQSKQNGIFTPDRNQLSGQGTFLRGAGGVLVHDTGHLVFDPESGSTIQASAMAIAFDDPSYPGIIEDALCALLG
jgi:hypothetical protein